MQQKFSEDIPKISRRELLEIWRKKKAEAEALKPPKIPAPKPKKFHEILRNDEIILNKPLKANCQIKEKIPSQRIISKSHSVSHKKENNINSTNVFVPIQSINQEFNKLSQKSKDIRSETNSQTEPILNLKEKNLIVNQGDDVILNDLNERIKIIYSLAEKNEDKLDWINEFKELFKSPDGKRMRYISFKSTIISAMDNIGSQLLLNPKIWLLWIKVIEGMLKKEDRFILYKECLKQIPSESRELIKRDYADYCNQNHLSGDEFLNILLKVKLDLPLKDQIDKKTPIDSNSELQEQIKLINDENRNPFENQQSNHSCSENKNKKNLKRKERENDLYDSHMEGSLKKVILNERKIENNSAIIEIKSNEKRKSSKSKGLTTPPILNEEQEELGNYGSGMKYTFIKFKSTSNEHILTPVRSSRRISIKSNSQSQSKRNQDFDGKSIEKSTSKAVSVRFVEDNDNINILDSQISNMFNPLDEETKKIREIIKNRKKTPYSKSRSETFDKEETESITMNNSSLQPLQIDFDRSESKFNTSNEKAKNGIETNEFSRRMSDSLTRLINPNQ